MIHASETERAATAASAAHNTSPRGVRSIYVRAAALDRFGVGMLRLGLVLVLVWIGALKFVP